ncbi:MAG: hypothetical protein KDD73_00735 [Anaerolineales bacterium]|nr:hypothetical protein [Anaerolineales bacterium]MCB9128434.1 hypothetical protein [Ardenticatenales bacterium]
MNSARLFLIFLLLLLTACTSQSAVEPTPPASPSAAQVAAASSATPRPAAPSASASPVVTATRPATATPRPRAVATSTVTPRPPTETALPTASASAVPATESAVPPTATALPPTATTVAAVTGSRCFQPPGNYERLTVRGHVITRRTQAMLTNAQALYGGVGSMQLLIQGSYAPGLGASFGTHDGGGAVDVWAINPDTGALLDDIPQMVWAMRQSGFAAWFRPADMLYEGMYPHIHAIAIGDDELSAAAYDQIHASYGYFAGNNGLPDVEFAGPDPHGGPIICDWMDSSVYGSTASAPVPTPTLPPPAPTATTSLACARPSDSYSRVTVNGWTLSQRSYGMLQVAQSLYGGPGDLLQVTQGSYSAGVSGSFGTHDGGGAVDLSIRHPQSGAILYGETERMVNALRLAGFAAWYRSPEQGFAPHIHAIAVGDAELSEAASAQLIGPEGYFYGRNGLPDERAGPDPHGGPIVCSWMSDMGYGDWR